MATWGDQTCQKFEATAVGFETELDMVCFVTVERSVIRMKQGVIWRSQLPEALVSHHA